MPASVLTNPEQKPWYRHLWPWLVMIPPAGAVVGGFITAWLAGGPPALVVDDYAEIAMSTELDQARDRRAAALGLNAQLRLDPVATRPALVTVSVELQSSERLTNLDTLSLRFVHATREEYDRDVSLERRAGRYSGQIERLPGRLYVHLTDPAGNWRLVGDLAAGINTLDLVAGEE
ncbi:MAG: FixH family protein [Gammaproteobacteria bacterium]|nr:FixH family protein [Gammaproteobacteria bacterium]